MNNTGIDTKLITIPFNFNVDFDGINTTSDVDTFVEIGMQDFVVTADNSVDVKVDIIFTTTLSKNTSINIIDDIEEDQNKTINQYSMIVYFVKPGDTLWKIAKRFGSTSAEISRVNGIEQVDKLSIGQQLFIPRYNG